jgi:hypothetical protein
MPTRRVPPSWDDEAEVCKFIGELICEGEDRGNIFDISLSEEDTRSLSERDIFERKWVRIQERDAIQAADPKRLAKLIVPVTTANGTVVVNPTIRHLSTKAWTFIHEILVGKRTVTTGRAKGHPGRVAKGTKMSLEDKRAIDPNTYAAAVMFPWIKRRLKENYRYVRPGDIDGRAEKIARKLYYARGSVKTLAKEIKRARNLDAQRARLVSLLRRRRD